MWRRTAMGSAIALTAPLLGVAAHAAAPAYTVKALTLTVKVAPEGAIGTTSCVVDADLYTPAGASRQHPVPAILTTNSFGGSKADQAVYGKTLATMGYAVLSYSGLGFGADPPSGRRGSDCKITLDDRTHDGAAGSQLIDFLGGIKKADDGTTVDYITKDKVAHDGKVHAGDVRVGMLGGSYGGQIQFAVAAVDPRLDTIIPFITWNDLSYSLAPNNTTFAPGSVHYATPGTEKLDWSTGLFALGLADGVEGVAMDRQPSRLGPCPNFEDDLCQVAVTVGTLGYADGASIAIARNSSVMSYLDKIRIPTLLPQGEGDTLFTLREAATTYAGLKAHHVPVKMVWQSWGHSTSAARPHEFDLSAPMGTYEGRMVIAWFDYWLKGTGRRPELDFSYYQDWKDRGDARTAYSSAPSYPLPGTTTLFGSGTTLVPTAKGLASGSTTFGVPGEAPLSYSETSVLQTTAPISTINPEDAPGTAASMSTGPLLTDLDVVGAPSATLQLASQTSNGTSPSTMLVAFVKLYDVAPDGTVTLPCRLVAPIRVHDLSKPVQVALPAIVHRFAKGHRLELVVALSDWAYRGNALGQLVTLSTSQASPTTLTVPGRFAAKDFG